MNNTVFICDFGLILYLFAMNKSHKIKFDDDTELCDYHDESPYINF